MVEAGANEVTEDEAVTALETAHNAIKQLVDMIDALAKEAGRTKLAKPEVKVNAELKAYVDNSFGALADAMRIKGKLVNYATVAKVEKDMIAGLPESLADQKGAAKGLFHDMQERALREEVLGKGIRQDGRKFDEIRQITIENTVLPRVHGSIAVHARRDAGARHRHARHRRRSAEDRNGRRRDVEALHAPLQLPALLGRRSEADARPRPS